MTADPRDSVSEITEIADRNVLLHARALLKAAWWGALSSGGLLLVFTIPIGFGVAADGEVVAGLSLTLFPLALAFAGAVAGTILVGLPATAILRDLRLESSAGYALIGLLAGAALPVLLITILEGWDDARGGAGLIFGAFGAIAGGVTGNIWGNFREGHVAEGSGPDSSPEKPSNPFHDMIH
jgi:hypothetical protein